MKKDYTIPEKYKEKCNKKWKEENNIAKDIIYLIMLVFFIVMMIVALDTSDSDTFTLIIITIILASIWCLVFIAGIISTFLLKRADCYQYYLDFKEKESLTSINTLDEISLYIEED